MVNAVKPIQHRANSKTVFEKRINSRCSASTRGTRGLLSVCCEDSALSETCGVNGNNQQRPILMELKIKQSIKKSINLFI